MLLCFFSEGNVFYGAICSYSPIVTIVCVFFFVVEQKNSNAFIRWNPIFQLLTVPPISAEERRKKTHSLKLPNV